MDPATINGGTFHVTVTPGPPVVAGKVTYYPAADTATFTPTGPLVAGSTYTATITTGARDLEGNALAVDFLFSFTAGTSSGLSPIDLGAATNFAVFAETLLPMSFGRDADQRRSRFEPGCLSHRIPAWDRERHDTDRQSARGRSVSRLRHRLRRRSWVIRPNDHRRKSCHPKFSSRDSIYPAPTRWR